MAESHRDKQPRSRPGAGGASKHAKTQAAAVRPEQSAQEGPAAYAPHNETENTGRKPTKKKTGEF